MQNSCCVVALDCVAFGLIVPFMVKKIMKILFGLFFFVFLLVFFNVINCKIEIFPKMNQSLIFGEINQKLSLK